MTRFHAATLLGVEPDAHADEVKHAFRQYARTHHPDHGGDPRRFDDVLTAREVLLQSPAGGRPRAFVKHEPWWRQFRVRRSR